MKKKFVMDNKGFSLVELIVVVLVTSILMLGVITFMTSSRKVYEAVNTSARLQEEALTVERVLSEFIMEAKPGYDSAGTQVVESYGYDMNFAFTATVGSETNSRMTDVLWINARENKYDPEGVSGASSTDALYLFVLDHNDQKLRYCKIETNEPQKYVERGVDNSTEDEIRITGDGKTKIISECYGTNAKFSLIAEHIQSMELKKVVGQPDGTDLLVIGVEYEYIGKTYTDTLTVVTRNKNAHIAAPDPD